MKNEAKLKQWELEGEVRYYYLKFGKGAEHVPDGFLGVATVCVIGEDFEGGRRYTRGVAFCSPKDQFAKKVGRAIALGRAVRAIEKRSSVDTIHRTTPAIVLAKSQGWAYLSEWDADLTEYENKLFKEEPK